MDIAQIRDVYYCNKKEAEGKGIVLILKFIKNQEKSTWNSIETTLTWGLHTYTNPWTNSVYGVIFRPRGLNHIPRCEILFVHERNLSIFLCTLGCPSMTSYAVTIRLKE